MPHPSLPATLPGELAAFDTCTIADAIERTDVRLRNEGFSASSVLQCHFPELPPMVGYAVTLRVRSSQPPMRGGRYRERTEWWEALADWPSPHVLLIEDLDHHPGRGAYLGETHAALFQAMGCVGVVTNGSVRSLPAIARRRLPLFSGSVSPSHAYIHVVEAGTPIELAGLRVSPGELIHGDQHGLVRIPLAVAPEIPAVAAQIQAHKQRLVALCESPQFSREMVRAAMNEPHE